MKFLLHIIVFSFFSLNAWSQYDSKKFTYNVDDKNYINYDQLDELTTKMLLTDKKYYNEDKVAYNIFLDKSELPDYTDEEIHKRLKAIPTNIPLKFTPQVGQLIRYFVYKRREYVTRMLTMSQTYFPIFEETFSEHELPLDLKCLSIVESALNPMAKSRVGATGLWQFMHGTAKHEGMDINTLYDERSDIYSSTEFAAKFLKKLYNIYGDWLLALAAYNSGPGNVNKAIRSSGGYDFWTIKSRLPRETQNYVPSFIAMVYVMYYHKDYKLLPGKPTIDFNKTTSELFMDKQSLKYIAEITGSSEDLLKQYNPCLKKGIIPYRESGYKLIMPIEVANALKTKKDLLPMDPYIYNPSFVAPTTDDNEIIADNAESTPDFNNKSPKYEVIKVEELDQKVINHKVHHGETLYSIARQYNVDIQDILSWNKIDKNENLFSGKNIKIHTTEKVIKPQYVIKQDAKSNSKERQIIHIVKKGESLEQLASKYNCTLADIMEWNFLSDDNAVVGQEIYIYQSASTPNKVQSYTLYEASNGDTLQSASTRFNIPIEVLKILNNHSENEPFKQGEKIKIPAL